MSNPPSDNGIPMLTEVIAPETAPAPAKPAVPAASASIPLHTTPATSAISPNPFSVLPKAAEIRTPPPAQAPAPSPAPAAPAVSSPLPPSSILKPQTPAPQPIPSLNTAPRPAIPAAPATPVPSAAAKPAVPPSDISTEPDWPEITTLTGIPADEWTRLENDIRQRISRQVLERIDFVLDHRLRSSVATVVDQAMDGMAAEIKRGLHETLEEIVSRAVSQEIARINSLKK